jgi:ELWxxDGT repeat protein
MSGSWAHRILGSTASRWLSAGRKRPRRPTPVRPALEQLERRELLSGTPFLVNDVNPGAASSYPHYLTNASGTLFFAANDGTHGTQLWKTDGTSSGTALVNVINPGGSALAFTNLTNVNGTVFFRATDGVHNYELWKTDGTSSGTTLVSDIYPSSLGTHSSYLANVNGTLFFQATDGVHGLELWKSDGSFSGTVMVKDIYSGAASSYAHYLTNVNGTVFFRATDGVHGYELWKSDGTSSGTVMVDDIRPGNLGSGAQNLTNVNGTLFFSASDGSHGYQLWKSDGTSSGTTLVNCIRAYGNSSYPHYLTNVSGTLFFIANDGNSSDELWKSDGTSSGTTLVKDIYPGVDRPFAFQLTNVNGTLFFNASDGSHGFELWKSDGSSSGTALVNDINPGSANSFPTALTNVNGTLFFDATDGSHGYELWQSDGSSSGTVLVKDINPGSASSDPDYMTNVNGALFFRANDGSTGFELWALSTTISPVLTSLSPSTAVEGSGAFTLTVTGSNFDSTASVLWNGTALTTQFDSASQLEAQVPAGLVADEGTATVSVTEDNGTTGGRPFTITDAALSSLTIHMPTVSEGISTGTFTLATFTDANTNAPATEFTASVSWGDGSSSAASVAATGTPGVFAVLGAHTYAEEGSFTLAVQVSDVGRSATSGILTIAVADHALANLSILAPTATEDKSTNLVTVATFADFLGAPATDFTALVHWGDNTTSTVTGAGIVAMRGGYFRVQAAHTYAEEGTYTLAVQVLDDGGANLAASRTLTVADAGLSNLGVFKPSATEGIGTGTFTVATFADKNAAAPATDFTATVSWGDGSSSTATVVRTGTGTFAVLAAHTYAEEAHCTLSVQVSDIGGASISGSRAIAVADAALTGLGLQDPHATEGLSTGTFTVATFTDKNAAAPVTDFTAAITWGDGSSTTVSAGGGGVVALGGGVFAVEAAHTYAQAGNYALSVQVLDTGGASIRGSRGVAVATPTLTNLVLSNLQPTEAKGIGLIRVASFHDSNVTAPATDFTATITWGDGGTTTLSGAAGNIVAVGNGWFYLLANYTYAEEGTFTLSVEVADVGGASISNGRVISVADAPLSQLKLQNPHASAGVSTGTFTVATFTDRNLSAPVADFTATIAWGDGATTTVSGSAGGIVSETGGVFALLSSYTYADAGTYTLSVQVLDEGSASITGSLKVAVS